MYDKYTIQFVCTSSESEESSTIAIKEGTIESIESILDLGMRHSEQIQLLLKIQDQILKLQSPVLVNKIDSCAKCGSKMKRNGYTKAEFNSVFTDHKVPVLKQRCTNKECDCSFVPSIRSIFGTTMHPDLAKLQCETGGEHPFRAAQNILNKQSASERKINNHERVHHVVESVGQHIADTTGSDVLPATTPASELLLQVDGGHLKDADPAQRSFEAMTAVVYRPEAVLYSIKAKDHRGKILNKNCAASALNDNQQYMKTAVLIAAKKQGMSTETSVTALCDGAANCWNIVESLESHCSNITKVLDWFHITMKFKNIAVHDDFKHDYDGAKWHLWHGSTDDALIKLRAIKEGINSEKIEDKISKLINYIDNNKKYIVCYEERKTKGLTFTSHLAEATVESLINQRCKGKQHMRWTRAGVHQLLQIRCSIASNDWNSIWQEKILGAMSKAA